MKIKIIVGSIFIIYGFGGLVQIGFYQSIFEKLLIIFMVSILWGIGIPLFKSGLKQLLANIATDKYGEDCYGLVCNHIPTNTALNDKPFLKARICVYVPSSSDTKIFDEKIGLDTHKYPVGAYVKCKYYKNDINLKYIVGENEIPESILKEISKFDGDISENI